MRILQCKMCGHNMRLGAQRCGSCWHRTPLMNRTSTYLIIVAIVIFAVLLL